MKFIIDGSKKNIEYVNGYIRYNDKDIFETKFDDFDVCADDKGKVYILCQNNSNGMYLITISGENVTPRCILESKVSEGYKKFFNIDYINGWLNSIYVIKHNNQRLIIHHIINSDIQPTVIDSVDGDTKVFMFRDKGNNLYAIYRNDKIGYRKYSWKSKAWETFKVITEQEGELLFANAIIDDELETVLSMKNQDTVSVICKEKSVIENIRENVQPVIIKYRQDTYILFEYQGRILQSIMYNDEEGFTKPKYAYFGTFSKYHILSVLTDDEAKIYTYGFKNARGMYEPLLVERCNKVKEENSNVPPPMDEKKSEQKSIEEILKLLENKNEYEILSQLMKRVSNIERILEELKNGDKTK